MSVSINHTATAKSSEHRNRDSIKYFNKYVIVVLVISLIVNLIMDLRTGQSLIYPGVIRTLLLLLIQVLSYYMVSKISYRLCALINLKAFYFLVYIYPFFNLAADSQENVFLPLVLLVTVVILPIMLFDASKDMKLIIGWIVLFFLTFLVNFYYQYILMKGSSYEQLFNVFIDYPMTLIGFLGTHYFLVSLVFYFKRFNAEYYQTLEDLNDDLKSRFREIIEQNNEFEAQNEEMQAMEEELLTTNNQLERKVEDRTEKLYQQKELLVKFTFMNSHVLRAPIARIKGLLNLDKHVGESREHKEIVELLKVEVKELDRSSNAINEIVANKDEEQFRLIEEQLNKIYNK